MVTILVTPTNMSPNFPNNLHILVLNNLQLNHMFYLQFQKIAHLCAKWWMFFIIINLSPSSISFQESKQNFLKVIYELFINMNLRTWIFFLGS
jgi:hypothetical protein